MFVLLKVIGLALLCLAVSATGFIYCERLLHRKKYLEQLSGFAGNCTDDMRCLNKNIFEIFAGHAKLELSFFKELNSENISDNKALRKILSGAGVREDDMFVITDFLIRMGASDLESQKTHCKYFSEKFSRLQREAEQELIEKGKLARTLCVLGSIALFIILI